MVYYDHSETRRAEDLLLQLFDDPKGFVDQQFVEVGDRGNAPNWVEKVTSSIQEIFYKPQRNLRNSLPPVNYMPMDQAKGMKGKLVRFRGMVQETKDPVMHLCSTTIKNTKTGVERKECLLYRENVPLGDDEIEVINVDDHGGDWVTNKDIRQVQLLHCITVPGENEWLRKDDSCYGGTRWKGLVSTNNGVVDSKASEFVSTFPDAQKAKFGYPLPSMYNDPPSRALLATVYLPNDGIKMNEIVDLYGFLYPTEGDENEGMGQEAELDTETGTVVTPHPPLRMLVMAFSKRNRWEEDSRLEPMMSMRFDQMLLSDGWMCNAAIWLKDLMEIVFEGDSLTASYVIANLFSGVTARVGQTIIGNYPVTLLGVPPHVIQTATKIIQNLVWKSVFLANVKERLVKDCFIPWKDHERSKLMGGILQLSPGTHLLLEETGLSPATPPGSSGQDEETRNLQNTPKGMENFKALKKLMEEQTVNYDFKYQEVEFHHDIPILGFCAFKKNTMFAECNTIKVPYEPKIVLELENYESKVAKALNHIPKIMGIRDFLSTSKTRTDIPFTIPNSVTDLIISQEFSEESRNLNPRPELRIRADELDRCMNLCRAWLKYLGESELTEELWNQIRAMEGERRERIWKVGS